ncbi:LptF/LptG family permease [Membranicola marinus]|uniref:LptF/LptG family permease n=1 Tax=Membranihabitans marinus TaxID=1227546 RepID=A0A953HV50_9BACT|nr:LptF/LptG family permease [Membranihabitans marinus]MBY5957091.1 LptF/LptG family permease [Membranihabitans marinus]
MKKLDRLILFEILPVFIVSFLISAFVLMMQFMFLYIDDIAGKGVGILVIMEFIFYLTLTFIPLALPISVLIASVMVYGALGERYELASIKSAGISYQRMLAPTLVFSVFVALFSFIASEYIIPVANVKARSRLFDMSTKKPTLNIKEGIFNNDFEGYGIRVGEKDADGSHIRDIILYDYSSNYKGSSSIIIAEKGQMVITPDESAFVMVLENGRQYQEVKRYNRGQAANEPFMVTHFNKYQKAFDLSDFQLQSTNENYFKNHESTMNTAQLRSTIDSTKTRLNNLQDRVDLEMSYELPFIRSAILEKREQEKQREKDSLAQVEKDSLLLDSVQLDTDTTIAAMDSVDTDEPEEDTVELLTKSSTIINPNRTIDVSGEEGMKAYDAFSWKHLTPTYLASLPSDSLLMEVIPGVNKSDMVSSLRSNLQSMKDQISYRSKQMDSDHRKIIKSTYELHFKFALAISCILFVLVGGAMGSIVRKGGFGYSLLISIVFFVAFIMMTILFRKTSEGGRISPVLAAYLPVLILLPIGVFLVYKAVKDSKMALDVDRIRAWVLKFVNRRKMQKEM